MLKVTDVELAIASLFELFIIKLFVERSPPTSVKVKMPLLLLGKELIDCKVNVILLVPVPIR